MVSIRTAQEQQPIAFDDWLSQLNASDSLTSRLRQFELPQENMLFGREMVEILIHLNMDEDTLVASYLFHYVEIHQLNHQRITEQMGETIAALISGVRKMDAIRVLRGKQSLRRSQSENQEQLNSLRRMLLSMVEDVRSVVIKMAERICALQAAKFKDEESKVLLARECAQIYAPLANRLGIGQLKWELEDMAFRYLHPVVYKQIAQKLDERRLDRETYIARTIATIQQKLDEEGIRATVYGRPKHLYSIWRKMQKKNLSFEQLYDIRAFRIIAERITDCYSALGIVHSNWQHLASEFDDYIITPKPNGYQSIHTVIYGPENKLLEIQIRTQQMHDDAELGVAAHWKYKEGSMGRDSSFEQRINWLRKILQWQDDLSDSQQLVDELRSQVLDDRVFVFTPKGDVVDLPVQSTPLDFAYYIHSDVGHKCVGAKVNQRIVSLTYRLQSGDQVDIMTGSNPAPSRDWLHPQYGYIQSARARSSVQIFFRKLDREQHCIAGRELIERELKKQHHSSTELKSVLPKFNLDSLDELYVQLGLGELGVFSVLHALRERQQTLTKSEESPTQTGTRQLRSNEQAVIVDGVGHLLCQFAKCCMPVSGDAIIGFITHGKGISVHRNDCQQLHHLLSRQPEREVDVSWEPSAQVSFEASIEIHCADRDNVLRDLTSTLATTNSRLLGVNSRSDKTRDHAVIRFQLEVPNQDSLHSALTKLSQVAGVHEVLRR